MLRRAYANGASVVRPPILMTEHEEEFRVQDILAHKPAHKKRDYLDEIEAAPVRIAESLLDSATGLALSDHYIPASIETSKNTSRTRKRTRTRGLRPISKS
ncbi:TPA: hypothetical protein ACH3X2_004055 [Trebouxia sp. C0005]